jgi:outer membrane lipoprotein SlyB
MNNTTPSRLRGFQLALVASAAAALGACSKSDPSVTPPIAEASAPNTVAMAPVAPAPVVATPAPAPAPVVVAQNTNRDAYDQGRRDQQRRDTNRAAARELPPRADRDSEVEPQRLRDRQQVAAAVCHECGVIEAVNAVEVQGDNKGVGAVAGGVGGALVGSRIAGGGNRTLGGVVGAVGGGLIGNAIEKHQRKATMYDVTVRMDDGTHRTVRESTAPAVGEKVRVESDGLHERG